MTTDLMPAGKGVIVLAEARRRVEAEHGPRPAVLSPHFVRPSFGPITAGWAVTDRMVGQFSAALESISAASAWDRLVRDACRQVTAEVSCGTLVLEGLNA